jgi:hypothetical protein
MAFDRVSASLRKLVEERSNGCCEYCRSQVRFAMQAFCVEHIEPRSLEGQTTLDNLAFACQGCNNHKYNRIQAPDPITGALTSIFHPRQHRWSEHFAWNADCSLVVGLTPIGRATINALQLNRPGLINLRKILFSAGEHPSPPIE